MPTALPDSDILGSTESILRLLFRESSGFKFGKFNYSISPASVYELLINSKYNKDYYRKRIVVLATSGIPFGMAFAQVYECPVHFYLRKGWEITNNRLGPRPKILPILPTNSKLLLIDSHSFTQKTALGCQETIIKNRGNNHQVEELITLIGLDHFGTQPKDKIPETSFISIMSNQDLLTRHFGSSLQTDLLDTLNKESEIWKSPEQSVDPGALNQPQFELSRVSSLARDVFYKPSSEQLQLTLINNNFQHKKARFEKYKSDDGVFDLFSNTTDMDMIRAACNKSGVLNDYDMLVGVQAIGTSLAWALLYKSGLNTPIISSFCEAGIVPIPVTSLNNKKILLIQGRMITGLDTATSISRIEQLGGSCNNVLTLWWKPELWNKIRCAPLFRLIDQRVKFTTFFC
ncbi:MAG: hypothetical protein KKC20_24785 [Proteobacteria bacterium]|nr:hypothetical protein [Pseudomonadota bacterium]